MLNLFFTTGKGDFAGKSFKVFSSPGNKLPEANEQGVKITVNLVRLHFFIAARASHCGKWRGRRGESGFCAWSHL